jgi:cyclopropane fatty-acyl-phospholipid synthase-like methyltransferase
MKPGFTNQFHKSAMMNKQNRYWRAVHLIALTVAFGLVPSWSWAEDRKLWQQPERVLADLHLPVGVQIGDIGCGGGYFTLRFAPIAGPSGKVFAVDVSAESLKSVRERIQRNRPKFLPLPTAARSARLGPCL